MTSPWWTTEEAAAYLRIEHRDGRPDRDEALRYLRKQVHAGRVRHTRRGRRWFFYDDDVRALMAPLTEDGARGW